MNIRLNRQAGGSGLVNLLLLAVLAYVLFVGIQYVPQWVESRSVQSILDDAKRTQRKDPVGSVQGAQAKIIRMLQINEMNHLTDSFQVSRSRGAFVVTFSYDRPLNLGFKAMQIHYEHSVRL